MYGPNLVADPYVKCDLITYTSGPHKADMNEPYINIYGFQTLPANSTLTIQIPKILRYDSHNIDASIKLSIMEETWGYNDPDIQLYSQEISYQRTEYIDEDDKNYDDATPNVTLTNSIINKVTDITINDINLTSAGVTTVIFEVDQTEFADIGRSETVTCGSHTCSKFNKPIQYFIINNPSPALTDLESFTFPDIATPQYAGDFTFKMRFYRSNSYESHIQFPVTITPEPLATAPTFQFDPVLENETVLYPNTLQYHNVIFTTVNALPTGTGSIKLTLTGGYTFNSQYCTLATAPVVSAYDGRLIQCQVDTSTNIVKIYNMQAVPASTQFTFTFELTSTSTASTISPLISV